MKSTTNSNSRLLLRSSGFGILLSLLFFYGIHLWGEWQLENPRPDAETTSHLQLKNECLIFHDLHVLSPSTGTSTSSADPGSLKFAASFMNFTDQHIGGILAGIVLFTLLVYGLIRLIRGRRA